MVMNARTSHNRCTKLVLKPGLLAQLFGFKNVTTTQFPKKNVVKNLEFSYFHFNCTIWCRGKRVFALKCSGTKKQKTIKTNNIGGTR
jgi:hypothetical protein